MLRQQLSTEATRLSSGTVTSEPFYKCILLQPSISCAYTPIRRKLKFNKMRLRPRYPSFFYPACIHEKWHWSSFSGSIHTKFSRTCWKLPGRRDWGSFGRRLCCSWVRGTGKETLVSSLIFHIFGIFYNKNF